jgi:hypothetical protein
MASTTSQVSSIAPSDSVSQFPASPTTSPFLKKPRPGRRQRQTGKPDFQGGYSEPVPQPGKFPVVFPTGAGVPSRDVTFSYSGPVLSDILSDHASIYENAPKLWEFLAHAGQDMEQVSRDICRMGLLSLAQKTAFSHVNMELPLGDFGPVSSTDLFLPRSLDIALSQFGEFPVAELGSRFLLADYASTVRSLVRAADQCVRGVNRKHVLSRMWLPATPHDRRTAHIVALALGNYFADHYGIMLSIQKLLDTFIFQGTVPGWFRSLCQVLPAGERDRFFFLSNRLVNEDQIVSLFTDDDNLDTFNVLGLHWDGDQDVGNLDFGLNTKMRFGSLSDDLMRRKPIYQKFFSLASTLSCKADARGSRSQLSRVETISGVTVVSSRLAMPAPELSLDACFPATALVSWYDAYNSVITTDIQIGTRKVEFVLTDLLS